MTCPDVELLDAFVDSELPPTQLLEVAQHAASCATCEVAIGELTALRQSVSALVEQEVDRLDLAGVWPAVQAGIGPNTDRKTDQPPAAPARVVPLRRKEWAMPALSAWGALGAVAAGLLFWVGAQYGQGGTPGSGPIATRPADNPVQIAKATRPVGSRNHADIDRLSGKDIAVRREPKSGTTIIWVSHQEPR